MKKFILFLKSYPWSLIGSVATVMGLILAVLVQLQVSKVETNYRQMRSEAILDEYNKQINELETKITKIENSLPIPDNLLDQSALTIKLKDMESKIEKIDKSTLALRQAVNPLNPEEVLTIARLKDEIVALRKDHIELKDTIHKDQDSFKQSILREAKASSQSTNLILVVLIPLVLNFLYTLWKDLKGSKKENP